MYIQDHDYVRECVLDLNTILRRMCHKMGAKVCVYNKQVLLSMFKQVHTGSGLC